MANRANAQGPVTEGRSLRVLVAEDNELNGALAARLLAKCGHAAVVVESGADALAAWAAGGFDLILMDLEMPHMDGIAATRAIREREKALASHTPIVALTAHAADAERTRCLAAGMDGFIAKPLRIAVLRETIAGLVAGRGGSTTDSPSADAAETFDLDRALKMVDGERELLEGMIEIFLRQTPRVMADVDAALSSAQPDALESAAHKLKGSVSMFGAHAAREAAQRLEELAAARDLSSAVAARDGLAAQIDRLEAALRALVREPR